MRRLAAQGLLIGDDWVASGGAGTHAHHNPSTGAVQAEVQLGDARRHRLRRQRRARAALPVWQAVPTTRRMAILHRLADLLDEHRAEACAINALDNGTPISIIDSGTYTGSWTRYYAGWVDKLTGEVAPVYAADHLNLVFHEPYGVVAVIPPWNGPMMGMGQKAAPALAAGNTVVAKPPEIAPFGAIRFAELALEAGLPPGVLNVVPGGAATGDALVRHPGIDKISFTGGIATARKVMAGASESLTPLTFELGGKSANIVFADADLDLACAVGGLLGSVMLSGQGCALPTRLYAHEDIYDEVAARVVAHAEGAVVGDPLDPTVTMGPVVTEQACDAHPRRDRTRPRRGSRNVAHRRKPNRWCARAGLLRCADRVRRRRPGQRPCPERDLRPGALGAPIPRRGRSGRARERHAVRPRRVRLHTRSRARHRVGARWTSAA